MKSIIKYSILYLIFTMTTLVAHNLDKDSIIIIKTEDDLKNLLKNNLGPSAISFHMDRCGWCVKMHPIFESLANNDAFCDITFYSVNGQLLKAHTHTQDILSESIDGYPSIFFMNQGELVDKQVGGTTKDIMMQKLNSIKDTPEKQKALSKSKQKAHVLKKN